MVVASAGLQLQGDVAGGPSLLTDCPIGQRPKGQLHWLVIRSSKKAGTQTEERHMPISQKREVDIEQELAAIVRELERCRPMEKRGSKKPEQAVQIPMGTILLDG